MGDTDVAGWIDSYQTPTFVFVETIIQERYKSVGWVENDLDGDVRLEDWMPMGDHDEDLLAWNLTLLALNGNFANWDLTSFNEDMDEPVTMPPPVRADRGTRRSPKLPDDVSINVKAAIESLNVEFVTVATLDDLNDYDWATHVPNSPIPETVDSIFEAVQEAGGTPASTRVYFVETEN